jgi:uncharacterized membrane protein YciS (DUF1049 family)
LVWILSVVVGMLAGLVLVLGWVITVLWYLMIELADLALTVGVTVQSISP